MNPDNVMLYMTQEELDIIWQYVKEAGSRGQWSDIAPEGSFIRDTINDFIRIASLNQNSTE